MLGRIELQPVCHIHLLYICTCARFTKYFMKMYKTALCGSLNLWMFACSSMTSLFVRAGPSPSQLPPREDGLRPFYEWLRAHNAEFDKVRNYYLCTCIYMMLMWKCKNVNACKISFVSVYKLKTYMYMHMYGCAG